MSDAGVGSGITGSEMEQFGFTNPQSGSQAGITGSQREQFGFENPNFAVNIDDGAEPRDPLAGVPPSDDGGQKVISPAEDKPAKVAEKKEGVKRKARKRSLLGEEDTTVYRRSILGS